MLASRANAPSAVCPLAFPPAGGAGGMGVDMRPDPEQLVLGGSASPLEWRGRGICRALMARRSDAGGAGARGVDTSAPILGREAFCAFSHWVWTDV